MHKISSRLNFKHAIALQIVGFSLVTMLLSKNLFQFLLAATALTFSLMFLKSHNAHNRIASSKKLVLKLESALKRGTTADPDNNSAASDMEIEIIMNQLKDAVISDESGKSKPDWCRAHEMVKAYRPWYRKKFFC